MGNVMEQDWEVMPVTSSLLSAMEHLTRLAEGDGHLSLSDVEVAMMPTLLMVSELEGRLAVERMSTEVISSGIDRLREAMSRRREERVSPAMTRLRNAVDGMRG